ncbi:MULTISPECIES: TetR/AcrR family transcriptional regulator [Auritidibacter]|uniref:TetR/AcrR family transcriptional regulator n=1 Tax=Auritidibacter ignavus TaxID=678932 RepID=A0AAJ6AK05_9MICC|nr:MULTISPECIES: TetR/AcrR family transcriptional regulator [Auritidibacter]PXA79706.1 hypothetical protein DCC25_07885 [Auritidibacter sp. NML120636]WGH80780.1 TetR/AcrR family transcriptional regulator [Auritidibacter ignavus]WGH83027.1 TetR/AcrR family transcriptional regulator [Auritidibacter ignavus]WGH85895.1 TetR/AcrR family transcriptional regulator [Auritidibacter ignavus]WGH88182.1 TetR/AcrR family transcriptional regulator [Auritidibacter ignavus]
MSRAGRDQPKQQRAIETREALLEGAARVFTKLNYAEARLKDIAAESGMSEGTIYFHFGNKADIAAAVIRAQQDRMTAVLTDVLGGPDAGIDKVLLLIQRLAVLISADSVVQGGISLAGQLDPGVVNVASEPFFEWIRITKTLIQDGIEDGSITDDIDVDEAAEFVNSLFVGAQTLSKMADSWASLPVRADRLAPYVLIALAPRKAHVK